MQETLEYSDVEYMPWVPIPPRSIPWADLFFKPEEVLQAEKEHYQR